MIAFLLLTFSFQLSLKPINCHNSLVFIFDTTNSMLDDWEDIKNASDIILDLMSPITKDFVFVPFNDPDFGPALLTHDKKHFRNELKNLTVGGGGDCSEMCFSALKLGLEMVSHNSHLYVMTDASEKDSNLLEDILILVQQRQSQVTFLLTEGCSDMVIDNYMKVAKVSMGEVLFLEESQDIFKILNFINRTLDKNIIYMTYIMNPGNITYQVKMRVDESLKSLTIILSGDNPIIELYDPWGKFVNLRRVIIKKTVVLKKLIVIEIDKPSTGLWKVNYRTDSQHLFKITGVSFIKLKYGFSNRNDVDMTETTNRPLQGAENYMLVEIEKGAEYVKKLVFVNIIDSSGFKLFHLELKRLKTNSSSNVYITHNFLLNDDFFYLNIYGIDRKGNEIKRASKTAIQVRKPERPYVIQENDVAITMNKTEILSCYIDSLIPINVEWIKDNQTLDKMQFRQSGKAEYIIESVNKSHEGDYYCKAYNDFGSDMKKSKVIVEDPIEIYVRFNLGEEIPPINQQSIDLVKNGKSDNNFNRIFSFTYFIIMIIYLIK